MHTEEKICYNVRIEMSSEAESSSTAGYLLAVRR